VNIPTDPRWDEVTRLRGQADDYARKGDMLAAAMLDSQASRLAASLLAAEKAAGATS
jgi:hypothetical protein